MTAPDSAFYPHREPKEPPEHVEIGAQELAEIIDNNERHINAILATNRRLKAILRKPRVKAPDNERRPTDETATPK